jgi:mono/diheme cytochrome c family protein
MKVTNTVLQSLTLAACAVLIAVSFTLLPGCKKEATTPGAATDSTLQTNTPGTKDSAKSATADAATPAAAISGKALVGQKLFYNTGLGKRKVSCASCHTDGQPTTKDSRIRPGHTLVGVTSRTSTWNGIFKGADLKKYAYGASLCAALYIERSEAGDYTKSLQPDEADALNEYFAAIAGSTNGMTKNLTIQWGAKPAFNDNETADPVASKAAAKAILKLPGDATNGQIVFGKTCQYCHAMTEKKVGPSLKDALKDIDFAAKTLRVGSAAMPFYGKDILTDQQCADVLAYIQQQLGK